MSQGALQGLPIDWPDNPAASIIVVVQPRVRNRETVAVQHGHKFLNPAIPQHLVAFRLDMLPQQNIVWFGVWPKQLEGGPPPPVERILKQGPLLLGAFGNAEHSVLTEAHVEAFLGNDSL